LPGSKLPKEVLTLFQQIRNLVSLAEQLLVLSLSMKAKQSGNHELSGNALLQTETILQILAIAKQLGVTSKDTEIISAALEC